MTVVHTSCIYKKMSVHLPFFFLRSETSCPCILKFGCSVCSLTVIEFDILLHSVLLLFLRSMFMSSEHNVIFTGIENFVD